MKTKRTDNANKTAMPDNNIIQANMENGLVMPSIRALAMLAAAMDAGPDGALRLWLETARMVDSLKALPPEKRNAVLDACGRKFLIDDGFERDEESDPPKDLATALRTALVTHTFEDAKRLLNIATDKTLYNLLHDIYIGDGHVGDGTTMTPIMIKSAEQRIREIIQSGRIDEELMGKLRLAQREKKSEAAKQNRTNASHRRERK